MLKKMMNNASNFSSRTLTLKTINHILKNERYNKMLDLLHKDLNKINFRHLLLLRGFKQDCVDKEISKKRVIIDEMMNQLHSICYVTEANK